MSGVDPNNPYERSFTALNGKGTYLSTRLLTHSGTTIAFALGKSNDGKRLFFDYSILNPKSRQLGQSAIDESEDVNQLDSRSWLDPVKTLQFSSQLRVVGEESVPAYEIPPVDGAERLVARDNVERQDVWMSTSISLTRLDVTNFEVVSDGKYIYLFRQSQAKTAAFVNPFIRSAAKPPPPIDDNLLCDRFVLVDDTLQRAVESRYRRSGQKRLPWSEQDSLGAQDIDNSLFYEPTFSLRFISAMGGRFCVLRIPTMTADVFKWSMFAFSTRSGQVEHYSMDTSDDGLFDVHGQIYYTCKNDAHKTIPVFSSSPGACVAETSNGPCGMLKTPILPQAAPMEKALSLSDPDTDATLFLSNPIDFSQSQFADGFTIEMWINVLQASKPTAGPSSCLISLTDGIAKRKAWPSLFIDDQSNLVLRLGPTDPVLLYSNKPLMPDTWTHVAMTYASHELSLLINGEVVAGTFSIPKDAGPGVLEAFASFVPDRTRRFRGEIDEIRVWNKPLQPQTISAKMRTRATALEPYLQACWHLDEGSGFRAYDATLGGHDIDIQLRKPVDPSVDIWTTSAAPVLSDFGVTRRTVRLPPHLLSAGGVSAGVYFEQITPPANKETGEVKTFKRSGRVLLCFVVKLKIKPELLLAAIDFEITAEGNLCGWPAELLLEPLQLSTSSASKPGRAATKMLYIDPQGLEVYGGILDIVDAQSQQDAPCIWDSANGSVSVLFRSVKDKVSALTYDISRTLSDKDAAPLGRASGLVFYSRIRQVKTVTTKIEKGPTNVNDELFDMTITTTLQDKSERRETWSAIPSDTKLFADILNGSPQLSLPSGSIGKYARMETYTLNVEIFVCSGYFTRNLPVGTCLEVGTCRYQVIHEATTSDTRVSVTRYVSGTLPVLGDDVSAIGYDYQKLFASTAPGAVSRSSLVSVTVAAANGTIGTGVTNFACGFERDSLVIASDGYTPSFTSPQPSLALKTFDGPADTVFSMLEDVLDTDAASGLTFESWLKVSEYTQSVIVAYCSKRLARSDGGQPEYQIFILALVPVAGQTSYQLVGNMNGNYFAIQSTIQLEKWFHIACSMKYTLALKFSQDNYVDFGNSMQWNLTDFSLAFTIQLDKPIEREQFLFGKGPSETKPPFLVTVRADRKLQLKFWARTADGQSIREFTTVSQWGLEINAPYRVFISRRMTRIKQKKGPGRLVQLVSIQAWNSLNAATISDRPPPIELLEASEPESGGSNPYIVAEGSVIEAGPVPGNDQPFTMGGASWVPPNFGFAGTMSTIRLWSRALDAPISGLGLAIVDPSDKDLIGSWSFRCDETKVLVNDVGSDSGKLRNGPVWVVTPYKPDQPFVVYLNGIKANVEQAPPLEFLKTPSGPNQLTLGNVMHGGVDTRYLELPKNFRGEYDELRIWDIPRSRESVTDTMDTRLTDLSPDIVVYLPFDDNDASSNVQGSVEFLNDASINCWHLTALNDSQTYKVLSEAPVGADAQCVRQVIGGHHDQGSSTVDRPSITEYGDMETTPTGQIDGIYKRAYAYIDPTGKLILNTGFRIGSLIIEWVSQVQTNPTLIGYIEGAPPIPVESFRPGEEEPHTSIKFRNPQSASVSFGLEVEEETGYSLEGSVSVGVSWEASVGIFVEERAAEGDIGVGEKFSLDVSHSQVRNNMSTTKTDSNMELKIDLAGGWPVTGAMFEPVNIGLALVESEVADVFALRLKMRGPVAPLVAYQLRPNLDIPKDRNLVSFQINKLYTKQGTLDGRRGLGNDPDYPNSSVAPKDASYYKPKEAYALKERIKRGEALLNGSKDQSVQPCRNICNTYVWTADGGTYQESTSIVDSISMEVGGNDNFKSSSGFTLDMEMKLAFFSTKFSLDALFSTRTSTTTKMAMESENGFELEAELPPPVDLRRDVKGKKIKEPGAVDAYRWMSFWLEPSAENTDTFFQKVVDPGWLANSDEPNASLCRELRDLLGKQSGTARTKAWRVLHRCTYVSRVPDKVAGLPLRPATDDELVQKKKAMLASDVTSNWLLIQTLEPLARGAINKSEVSDRIGAKCKELYPTLKSSDRYYDQVVVLMMDYLGIE